MLDVEKVAGSLIDHVRRFVAPLADRIAALEARKPEKGEKGDRGNDGQNGIDGKAGADGAPGRDGNNGKDGNDGLVGERGEKGSDGPPGRDGRDGQPGPAGKDGLNGKDGRDGIDGKDGAPGINGKDGLGWDDMAVEFDGERSFKFVTVRGEQRKEHGSFVVPVPIYRGVFISGQSYKACDRVTWGGSEWHANEETSAKPGDGSKAWTLAVKKGRDGRDGDKGATGDRGPQGLPGRDRTI